MYLPRQLCRFGVVGRPAAMVCGLIGQRFELGNPAGGGDRGESALQRRVEQSLQRLEVPLGGLGVEDGGVGHGVAWGAPA